jgi:transcription initiation factor TFIID TATA-box-binding protein
MINFNRRNIVATASLDIKIDLKPLALIALNCRYKPEKFSALVINLRKPKTTAQIFSSGKIVCCGAQSIEESYKAIRRFARMIQKLGHKVFQ